MSNQVSRSTGHWQIVCAVLLCSVLSLSDAQPLPFGKSGQDIPDALRSIPTAMGSCRRDDAAAPPGETRKSQTDKTFNLNCAISAQEAALLLAKPESALIDLRPPADYLEWHAPNSMNLTSTEIITKPYFRDKVLVLMGTGKLEAESQLACVRLKQSGFGQVYAIRGGILAWLQHGYPTQGTAPLISEAFKISSVELWAAAQFTENRIYLDSDRSSLRPLIPNATVLTEDVFNALKASNSKKMDKRKASSVMSVILVASSDTNEKRLRELQQATLPNPLLIYSGTDAAYRAFVSQQNAMLSAHARGPKKLGCGL